MKRCPSCKRTFDDGLSFCLMDGAVLDPPFDHVDNPPKQQVAPPITEIIPADILSEVVLPRTVQSPVSTIVAALPSVPKVASGHDQKSPRRSRIIQRTSNLGWVWWFVLIIFVIPAIIGFIFLLIEIISKMS